MTNAMAVAGETTKAGASGGLNITLDVAALLHALIWPIVLLVIFLAYRRNIPAVVRDIAPFLKGLANRLSKLEFGGVSFELARAKAFSPDWSEAAGGLDLRRRAVALEINDSYTGTFRAQLMEEGSWEYAEINLGAGQEWLTSRLFIMAIVFARMKGIKCLVFFQTSGNVQRRFVCWAEPEKVRWALAKRFPWLEEAYAAAYSAVINFPDIAPQNQPNVPPIMQAGLIVSNEGRLGAEAEAANPWPSIALIQQFVARIQSPPGKHPEDSANWVFIASTAQPCEEHARWIGSLELEDLLGTDCHKAQVDSSALRANDPTKHLQKILAVPERFVAVTGAELRFEYLIDRRVILEQVAKQLASQTEERT